MEQNLITLYLGWSAWVLVLIPVVLLVRLLCRRSRWSILRMVLVSLVGVAVAALWLRCGETALGLDPGALGGILGERLHTGLAGWTKSPAATYFISSALFFLWAVAALLDGIVATARFLINKPYVREVVCEVVKEVEVEKPVRKAKPEKEPSGKPSGGKGRKSPDTPPQKKDVSSVDEVPDYRIPAPSLLRDGSAGHHEVTRDEIARNVAVIRETLSDHHVQVADIEAVPGPTVTLYKVYPAKGVKVSAIRALADDVSVALKTGKVMATLMTDCVGLEVANRQRSAVTMRELLESEEFRGSTASLPVVIGREITGKVKVFDLAGAPHLLVAGATGMGKSVGLNVLVASLLSAKRPSELKLVFIDPKKTEFSRYSRLYSHYLAIAPDAASEEDERARAIVKKPEDADRILRSLCEEMSRRYDLLEKAGTPEIKEYNSKYTARQLNPKNGHRYLPYVVAIIDEYSQLTLGTGGPESRAHARSIMTSIISLAQMGRACGIHLVIATQTPRREVISGLIKANFPMSIAFGVKTDVDSRVILDQIGAEKLLGDGDMLISKNASTERVQCGYISSSEIDALTRAVEGQKGYGKSFSTPYYLPEVKDDGGEGSGGGVDMKRLDERFEEAARLVVTNQNASTSYLQTSLGMGFAKSARVMSQLEAAGIVGPQNGAKKREVLVQSLGELEPILQSYRNDK